VTAHLRAKEPVSVPERETVDAFTALYDEYYPRVYAYVVGKVGRQLADEVVSDTFLVAWRRRGDIPDPALPWLLGVARNVAREQTRGQARQASLAAELAARTSQAELTAVDVADGVVERATVLRALATLSDGERELLTLVAWHGLTAADAARVLGCSRAAYFVRLHRARIRLERAIGKAGEPPPPLARAPAPDPTTLTYRKKESMR
jgi:RNA polymerase sigma-70 factor (ECF subfamily)